MDINDIPIKQDKNPVVDSRTQVSAEEFNTIVEASKGSVCDVSIRNDESGHLVIEVAKNKGTSHPVSLHSASESFDGILSKEDKKKIDDAAKEIPVLNNKIVTETERAKQADSELYNEWNDKKNEFNQKMDFAIQSCNDNNEKNDALQAAWKQKETALDEAIAEAESTITEAEEIINAAQQQQAQANALLGSVTELGAATNAQQVSYDNSQSGMTAVTAQAAIDELSEKKASKQEDAVKAGYAMVVDVDGVVKPMIKLGEKEVTASGNVFDKDAEVQYLNIQGSTHTLIASEFSILMPLPFRSVEGERVLAKLFNKTFADCDIENLYIVDTDTAPLADVAYYKAGYSNMENSRCYTEPYEVNGRYLSICVKYTRTVTEEDILIIRNNLYVKRSTGISWPVAYEEPSKPYLIPLFALASEVEGKLQKNFGVQNYGKVLSVDPNGEIVPVYPQTEEGGDYTKCVRADNTRTLYMGSNLLADIKGTGEGWTEDNGTYTHTSGYNAPLEFPLPTDADTAYVIILYTGTSEFGENQVNVSIGGGELCDIYKGITGPYYVGVVADGGNLKITPDLYYSSTVYGIELRKLVPEAEAEVSYEYQINNVTTAGDAELTAFWNIAIGANTSTLGKNQNGSRNVAIGLNTLTNMTSGERNVAIGTFALNQLKHGCRNIAIGADALYRTSHANSNVAIGKAAAGHTHSNPDEHSYNYNTAVGYNALSANSKNYKNNTAIGANAAGGGTGSRDRVDTTAVGHEAGYYGATSNTAVGARAGRYSKGDRNVFLGAETGDNTETGSDNILIGYRAKVLSGEGTWQEPAEHNNSIVIGSYAQATKSNQVVIGNSSQTEMVVLGNKLLKFNSNGTVTWETIAT